MLERPSPWLSPAGPAGVALGLLGLALLAGCHEFATVAEQRCGNGVLEPSADEDCDRLAADSPYACGAAGQPGACRYLCQSTPCPDGWGCGQDGVCRAPSGDFTEAEIVPLIGETMAFGDLDGDGVVDLLAASTAALHIAYGSAEKRFSAPIDFPIGSPEEDPVVFDLDDQPGAEIAVALEAGTLVLPGAVDRALVPAATPTRLAPTPAIALPLLATPPYQTTTLLLFDPDNGLSLADASLEVGALRLPRSPTPGAVIGHIAVADLDPDPSAQEFALAIPGTRQIFVLSLACASEAACAVEARQVVDLPPGAMASGAGTFFGDLDGDGALDLLVGIELRGPDIAVAYGGPEGFGAARLEPGLGPAVRCPNCPPGELGFLTLTDVGDLDGDGIADLATGRGLFRVFGGGPPPRAELLVRFPTPYRVARFADLNDDGRLDVYGVRPESSEIFLNGDTLLFTRFSVPLADEALELLHGDFDGDGRQDLVALDDTGGISIVFASEQPFPTEQVQIARVDPDVSRLARVRSVDRMFADGADDLVVFDGTSEFRFTGTSSRRPAALAPGLAGPSLLVAGAFGGDGPSLLSGSSGGPMGEQFGRATGAQLLGAQPFDLDRLGSAACAGPPSALSHWSRAVDLDGDGRDEVVAVERRLSRDGMRPLAINVLDVEDGAIGCRQSFALPAGVGPSAESLADVDGDGAPDLLVWVDPDEAGMGAGPAGPAGMSPPMSSPSVPGVAALVYLRGQPGGFAEPVVLPVEGPLTGLAAARIGDSIAPTWITVSAGAVSQVRVVDGAVALTPLFGAPPDAVEIGAADFDGDGLADIVVKTPGSALISRQTACDARAAAAGRCARGTVGQ